uniref:Hydrophobin n=1 Tax=Moniliophthora roreri TaxID=221103 RepID=A0A0W0GEQ8_MONRR
MPTHFPSGYKVSTSKTINSVLKARASLHTTSKVHLALTKTYKRLSVDFDSSNGQFKLFSVAFLASLAAATTIPASPCTTGPIQCRNSKDLADGPTACILLGLLIVLVQSADVLVGIACNPIDVIGLGSEVCSAEPLCCTNNDFSKLDASSGFRLFNPDQDRLFYAFLDGVIAIGCVPVDLDL